MIANKDLISAYMRHIGKTYVTNDADDLTPLLPFFILDVEYQLYSKYILPLRCSHDARRWKAIWGQTYTALNRDFFSAFTDEQRDAVIERMDGMTDFVSEDIVKTQDTVVAYLATQIPRDKCGVISVCMMCSALAQSAGIVYEQVYRGEKGRGAKNPRIEKLIHCISRFLNSWHKPDRHITCNDDSEVDAAVTRLQARLVAWLPESRGWQTPSEADKT